jgi:hypothetical protein
MTFARLLVAVVACCAVLPTAAAAAPGPDAQLQLVTTSNQVDAVRYQPNQPAFAEFPAFIVPASSSPFELRVGRAELGKPITVTQVVYGAGGPTDRSLPGGLVTDFRNGGLERFFRLSVADQLGKVRIRRDSSFCPAYRTRASPGSAEQPTYPDVCGTWFGGNPFILAQVWGIESGWAAPALGFDQSVLDLPDGTYLGQLLVLDRYRQLFGIPGADAVASFTIHVRTLPPGGMPGQPARPPDLRQHSVASGLPAPPAPERPTGPPTAKPDPATVPDLTPVPAWGVQAVLDNQHHDQLTFSATVWNAGPARLSVDGFRRNGTNLMDAYQNFYRDGKPVGYQLVGTFQYDPRPGHEHWHFSDFATYNLLDAHGSRVMRSGKEAFCIAPTDAENLMVPGADWRPSYLGFGQCGTQASISLNETMPAGWGDTYIQSLPGQAFDITSLPNGIYQIEVLANPLGRLYETNTANNRSLRQVRLGGTPGHRTAVALPYNGITG